MAARRLVTLFIIVWMVAASTAGAAEPAPADASGSASGIVEERLDTFDAAPRVSGELGARVERRLREAFAISLERVRDVPECRALFEALGDDASRRMSWSRYSAATAQMEVRVCRRNVPAFTYVGSPQTRLCRRFASMGAERAAVTVLHEALHGAGLTERPHDPDGLSPREIDHLVMAACGLER